MTSNASQDLRVIYRVAIIRIREFLYWYLKQDGLKTVAGAQENNPRFSFCIEFL